MKKLFSIISIVAMAVVGLSSCNILGPGYDTLPQWKKDRVKNASEMNLESLTADGNVYQVTPEQMKAYLKGRGRLVVYSYKTWCGSSVCVTPDVAEEQCKEAGVGLVTIAEDYTCLFEKMTEYTLPVFVIDNKALNSHMQEKYVGLFYEILTETEGSLDTWSKYSGSFYCFDGDRFLKQFHTIDDAVAYWKSVE